MNILIDQNISFRVLPLLLNSFQNVKHVKELNLIDVSDFKIWVYALKNDYTIITFDSDFIDFANLKGAPPKIIWLRFGNSNNLKIANKLISNYQAVENFMLNDDASFLEID